MLVRTHPNQEARYYCDELGDLCTYGSSPPKNENPRVFVDSRRESNIGVMEETFLLCDFLI
jgi:hypothetical protein